MKKFYNLRVWSFSFQTSEKFQGPTISDHTITDQIVIHQCTGFIQARLCNIQGLFKDF